MDKTSKPDSTIKLIQGGPMIITGSFEIRGADGSMIELTPIQMLQGVALCRCGRSQNKPFCDGAHTKNL